MAHTGTLQGLHSKHHKENSCPALSSQQAMHWDPAAGTLSSACCCSDPAKGEPVAGRSRVILPRQLCVPSSFHPSWSQSAPECGSHTEARETLLSPVPVWGLLSYGRETGQVLITDVGWRRHKKYLCPWGEQLGRDHNQKVPIQSKISKEPWLVWLSGLRASLQTKGSQVRFPVRAQAWVVGQVPSRGHMSGNHTLMFFSIPSPLSKNK